MSDPKEALDAAAVELLRVRPSSYARDIINAHMKQRQIRIASGAGVVPCYQDRILANLEGIASGQVLVKPRPERS